MLSKAERRRLEARLAELGEGVWFRNGDNVPLKVDVTLYPKTQRWITENGVRRKITEQELRENYHRLRL